MCASLLHSCWSQRENGSETAQDQVSRSQVQKISNLRLLAKCGTLRPGCPVRVSREQPPAGRILSWPGTKTQRKAKSAEARRKRKINENIGGFYLSYQSDLQLIFYRLLSPNACKTKTLLFDLSVHPASKFKLGFSARVNQVCARWVPHPSRTTA